MSLAQPVVSAVMTESLEDILGGVEAEIRRAEERLRLDEPRPKRCTETQARSSIGQLDGLAARLPTIEANWVEGRVGSREAAIGRRLEDALLPERRTGRETRPHRRRAWVDLEKDCPGVTTSTTTSGEGMVGRSSRDRFSSLREREAMVDRLLREREARLRPSVAALVAAADNHAEQTRDRGVSVTEAARSHSYGSCISANSDGDGDGGGGGGGDGGKSLAEEDRRTRRRETLNGLFVDGGGWRRGSRGGGSSSGVFDGFHGGKEGVSPVSSQGNIFFASDILEAGDHGVESPRKESNTVSVRCEDPNVTLGVLQSQGERVFDSGSEEVMILASPAVTKSSPGWRGPDRMPYKSPSFSNNQECTISRDCRARSRPCDSSGGDMQRISPLPSSRTMVKPTHRRLSPETRQALERGTEKGGDGGRDSSKSRETTSRLSRSGGGNLGHLSPTVDWGTGCLDDDKRVLSPRRAAGGTDSAAWGPAGDRRRRTDGRMKEEGDRLAAVRRLEDLLFIQPKRGRRSSLQMVEETQLARGNGGGGGGGSGGKSRRIEELARSRAAVYSERERLRKELQQEKEAKECTFRPKITTAAAPRRKCDDSADSDRRGLVPLHERLHREAREREAARALVQHHLEAKTLLECTFQPTLTAAVAAPFGQRPLHQRVWEVEREREHKLRLLQADKEEREGATFAPPPLGRVSQRLTRDAGGAGGSGGGMSVVARLEEQAAWARERRHLLLQEREEAEARVSTFEPTLSRGTESLARRRPELGAPFEQRRSIMEAKAKERQRRRLVERAQQEKSWFNPPTARQTEALLRRRMPQRLEETVEQRVSRMASPEDKRRRECASLQLAKEKRECTFRPCLNPLTRSVGRAAPLDELVNNRRGQRVRERALAKVSDRDAQACPHKPVLVAEQALLREQQKQQQQRQRQKRYAGGPPLTWASSRAASTLSETDEEEVLAGGDQLGKDPERLGPPRRAASLYGPGNKYRLSLGEPSKMTAGFRAREHHQGERVRAQRLEQEAAEMRPCTFAPHTNDRVLRAQGPVLVRGLGRHLELKDVAQKRGEERREREAHAFGVRPGAVRRTALGETVLKPFSLSEGNSRGWWEERRSRHAEERAAQCPFQPWTVEGERSRAMSRLLECSSMLAGSVACGES